MKHHTPTVSSRMTSNRHSDHPHAFAYTLGNTSWQFGARLKASGNVAELDRGFANHLRH